MDRYVLSRGFLFCKKHKKFDKSVDNISETIYNRYIESDITLLKINKRDLLLFNHNIL